jgi:hypothetical protein
MSITQTSLAEILREHVTLEVESIDRMYLNVYIPNLQRESGASWFLKQQWQYPVASSAAMAPISRAFVEAIETYAQVHQVPLLAFEKGQRKDDVVAPYIQQAAGQEGIVLIGKAQEKTTTFRTTKGHGPRSAARYPCLLHSTALVNQYYFYGIDVDFGPFFFKFSSYFPYTAKFCLNDHEYLKRQLAQAGIAYEALDNGILSCAASDQLQAMADGLSAEKIEDLVRASGKPACRNRSQPASAPLGMTMTSPSCKPSSPSRRSWIVRKPDGYSLKRPSARTWIWVDRSKSN